MTDMTSQRIVASVPDLEKIQRTANVRYGSGDLGFDLCRSSDREGESLPVIVFVAGYPDDGFQNVMGSRFKDMACYQSWAELVAAHGFAGVTYEANDPHEDPLRLLEYLENRSEELHLDPDRIGLWACSGNSPAALSLIGAAGEKITCLASLYGYLKDPSDSDDVTAVAGQFGFVTADGFSLDDLRHIPTLLVRAGRDEMPSLNKVADVFLAAGLERNLPLSLVNYPEGIHAFDLTDSSAEALSVIAQVVAFFRHQLGLETLWQSNSSPFRICVH